jgi:hypothetical protein
MANQSLQLSASELIRMGFSAPFAEEFLYLQRALKALQTSETEQETELTGLYELILALQGDKVQRIFGVATIPAAATSVIVTETSVTTDSSVFVTINDNDATALSVQAVPGTGEFEIFPNAAPTADCRVSWQVINP